MDFPVLQILNLVKNDSQGGLSGVAKVLDKTEYECLKSSVGIDGCL